MMVALELGIYSEIETVWTVVIIIIKKQNAVRREHIERTG